MIYLIGSVLVSIVLYRFGIRNLFRSKLLSDAKADLIAYITLMLSGAIIAEYLTIELIPHLFQPNYWELVTIATLTSILTGEFIYNRNYQIVKKVLNQ